MRIVNENGKKADQIKQQIAVNQPKQFKKKTVTSFAVIGLIGLAMFGVGGLHHSNVINHNKTVLTQEKNINVNLENKIAIKKAANKKATQNAGQSITGLDYVRQDKDDKIMNQFFNRILTWKNADEYRQNRDWALKNYTIDKTSQFAQVLLPSVEQTNIGVGDKGNNEIDINKYNMKFLDMKSYVTDIRGSDYTYFAVVRVQTHDKQGAVATGKFAVMYTMNGHDRFYNASAYATD